MAKDNTITGIDIGSKAIRIVVGKVDGERMHIIGGAESPSAGISKGEVTSIEDAVSSISKALEKVERMTGLPIERAYVGISGSGIKSQESQGVVATAKADSEIRENDVERALEAAQTVAIPPNYEILHVIPRSFVIDNQTNIKDPVGMTGVRLEVEAQIIEVPSSQIKNLTKCVYRTGVNIEDLVFSILATAEAVLNKNQKELGVAVVNIGGATTSVAVFEEGDILGTYVLPIGSNHITNDLAIVLRTSIELAEKVKIEFGIAFSDDVKKGDQIDLTEISGGEESLVSKKRLAEVIEARVEEIFSLVDEKLKELDRSAKLPSGVVLTGGGSKIPGLVAVAKRVFRLPASLGYPKAGDSIMAVDKINDLTFTTAIGLVLWGQDMQTVEGGGSGFFRSFSIEALKARLGRLFG